MEEIETNEAPSCPKCQALIATGDAFCGNCGFELKSSGPEAGIVKEDVFKTLLPTLLYYFTTLIFLIIYKFTEFFPSGLEGNVVASVVVSLIVIAFWANSIKETKSLFSLSKVSPALLIFTVVGAAVGSVIVSALAYVINISINDDTFYSTTIFYETSNPLLYATLLIAVQPAIFEEVAFRGFLFNNLKKIAGGASAVYITGFLFGIMHIQFISLIWLIPIGLVFGYMRNKFDTLWYGIIGHFTYNFCITVFDFQGWF